MKWVVRYLLIETGSWLFRRKAMAVPEQVEHFNHAEKLGKLSIRAEEFRRCQRFEREPAVRPLLGTEQPSPGRRAGPRTTR